MRHNYQKVYKVAGLTREAIGECVVARYRFPENYKCTCAISSFALYDILNELEIENQFVVGTFQHKPHAYNIVGRKIVDITATQFDLAPVEVRSIHDEDYRPHLMNDKAFNFLHFGWMKYQAPNTYRKDLKEVKKIVLDQLGV